MAAHKKPKPKPKVTAREKKTLATRAAFNKVCDRIEAGESVKDITADSKKAGISQSGFYKMMRAGDDGLVERYTHAREVQADRMAEEILEIADDARNDFMVKAGKDGKKTTAFNDEHVRRSHLRIETRKWLAGKHRPKVYGERQTVDVKLTIENMDDAELLARAVKAAEKLGITLPANLLKPAGHRSDGG
jgi:hypothetical protein